MNAMLPESVRLGPHYAGLTIHPDEFCITNGWDAGAFSILKYVTRFRGKNGLQDLRKARNFVDRRALFAERIGFPGPPTISMERYIRANGIPATDIPALLALEQLVLCVHTEAAARSDVVAAHLDNLIAWVGEDPSFAR